MKSCGQPKFNRGLWIHIGRRWPNEMAERDGWTVLTADKDFGEIVYRDRTSRCGIILLRFDDLPVSSAIVRLKAVWSVIEANAVGRFIVVTETRIRVRALPYSN